MRRISAAVAGVLVLTALTACSGTGATDCDTAAGNASSAVRATGAFGSAPEVSFPTPLITRSLETSVIEPGTGELLHDGQSAIVEVTLLDGTTGAIGASTRYSGTYTTEQGAFLISVGGSEFPILGDGLACASIGSRIAVTAPEDYGLTENANGLSTVWVVDVVAAFPSRAWGADQLPVNGMPSVVEAPDGTPGITVPRGDAPSDRRTELLRAGDGVEIEANDRVIAKYTAVNWDTGRVVASVESTWQSGNAAQIVVGNAAGELGTGFVDSVVGQRVGSRVLSVVPPAEAPATSGVSGALVWVIDILGTVG